MALNVLIVGAGICGPALAALLRRSTPNHTITVLERFPSMRLAGQQIDIKGDGLPVMRKMGLLGTLKPYCVNETGMDFVDSNGKVLMHSGVNDAESGSQANLTNEYEIMRGDLAKVLQDASLAYEGKEGDGGLKYEFGQWITELDQDDNGVNITLSNGEKRRYDVVIGADGQGSRTRRQAFGKDANDEAFKSLGVHAAYYSIPRVESDDDNAKIYVTHGGRSIMRRTGDRPITQVYFWLMKDAEQMRECTKQPLEKQKDVWAEAFKGAGWQTDRFIEGLKTCDDFYAHELVQIKLKQLYKGRVVLVGDAGYCPSVFTGMGTPSALAGAYVLAGELARHGSDVHSALKKYDEIMQKPVQEWQKLPSIGLESMFPSSRLAVWALHKAVWAVSALRLDRLMNRLQPAGKDESGFPFPDYPELNLES